MKKYFFAALLAAGSLGVTSCSPFQVKSDYSETANFSTFHTYKFRVDDLKLNDIDKDRVMNELSKQLQAKGLTPGENPDLIINVKANHKRVHDVQVTPSIGMFGWGGRFGMGMGVGHTWSNNYNQGSLIVDMIDARTQKLVWQGAGDGISVDSPRSKQTEIPEIVKEILANYPPHKGK